MEFTPSKETPSQLLLNRDTRRLAGVTTQKVDGDNRHLCNGQAAHTFDIAQCRSQGSSKRGASTGKPLRVRQNRPPRRSRAQPGGKVLARDVRHARARRKAPPARACVLDKAMTSDEYRLPRPQLQRYHGQRQCRKAGNGNSRDKANLPPSRTIATNSRTSTPTRCTNIHAFNRILVTAACRSTNLHDSENVYFD